MTKFREADVSGPDDFLAKIDWEGGVWDALEYGLRESDYDLPAEMAEGWAEIRADFDALAERVESWQARFHAEAG